MSDLLTRIQDAEKAVAEAQSEHDRLDGRIEHHKEQILQQTGSKTEKGAWTAVKKWEEEADELEAEAWNIMDEVEKAMDGPEDDE